MMQAAIRGDTLKKERPVAGKTNGAGIYRSNPNNTKSGTYKPRLSFPDVRAAAYGRWEYIHSALGVKIQTTNHRKHTACPGCGGKDRFHVKADYANTGAWFCRGGGDYQAGDGFGLLTHVFGWTPEQSKNAVADLLGISEMDNSAYQQLRAQAEKQAALIQAAKTKRDELERSYSNMLDAILDLEEGIKTARYNLRKVTQITDGKTIMQPPSELIAAMKNLIGAVIDGFSEHLNGGADA